MKAPTICETDTNNILFLLLFLSDDNDLIQRISARIESYLSRQIANHLICKFLLDTIKQWRE